VELDTLALRAKQGTRAVCPSCGKETTVRYSFRDSLKDFHGCFVRDPKYVSRTLTYVFFVVCGIVLVLTLAVWLR
jgi:hypothetical protein